MKNGRRRDEIVVIQWRLGSVEFQRVFESLFRGFID